MHVAEADSPHMRPNIYLKEILVMYQTESFQHMGQDMFFCETVS